MFIAPLSFNESTSSASKEQERLKVDDLVALKSSSEEDEEEVSISLHLGEPKLKKPKFF